MTLENQIIKNIIKKIIKWEKYRIEVISLINAEFLQFSMDFFKHVIDAKNKHKDLNADWYQKTLLW